MPFVKGQVANPRGRPKKGSAIVDFLRYQGGLPAPENERKTQAQAVAEALFQAARGGDVAAIKVLLDRIDGPVPTKVTGGDGGPLRVVFSWGDHDDDR